MSVKLNENEPLRVPVGEDVYSCRILCDVLHSIMQNKAVSFSTADGLEEGSKLTILELHNRLKGLGHVLLGLVLIKKAMYCNDVGDVVFIVPSLEGDHLVVTPIREFYLDLCLLLLLVEVRRLNVRDGGQLMMVPHLHSESLSPSGGLFAFLLMIAVRSSLVSKNSCFKLLFGGDLRIQSSVSLEILAENEILDLESILLLDSYVNILAIKLMEVTNQRKSPTSNTTLRR